MDLWVIKTAKVNGKKGFFIYALCALYLCKCYIETRVRLS